jgi:Protein of unknown function (DUF2851)
MTQSVRVCESPQRYKNRPPLRESELSRLWEAQRLPAEALVTDRGEEVHIVYRGRRGAGPGPDFRDAVIGTPGASLLKGDIELHVRSSDFHRHGHHLDRGYLRLALHVVFEHDGGPTTLLDGRTVPTIALGRWVERRAGELRALLADPVEYREPCHTAIDRLGAGTVTSALEEIGITRLRERARRLPPSIERDGSQQALYAAVARALGLTRNCEQMEAIAAALPLPDLLALIDGAAEPGLIAEAMLLGTAGLLDGQLRMWPGREDNARQRLLAAWQRHGGLALHLNWAPGLQRPGCAPADRLAGLAALICRAGPPFDATFVDWRAWLASAPRDQLACLQAPRTIGHDRALEIAINAVLPWLIANSGGDAGLEQEIIGVYRGLPGPQPYGRTRLLATALSDIKCSSLVQGAAAVQGALQMTRDWCTQGGCGRCPLSPPLSP